VNLSLQDQGRSRSADEWQGPRVEHVGSLLPPPRLTDAVEAYRQRQLSSEAVHAVEDDAIRSVVAEQESHGLSLITDGEFRRLIGQYFDDSGIVEAVRFGLTGRRQLPTGEHRSDTAPLRRSHSSTGGMALIDDSHEARSHGQDNGLLEEYTFVQALTDRPVKVSLLGPDYVINVLNHSPGSQDVDSFREAFAATVRFERRMITEVVGAGCRYLQLDAPGYLAYGDPACLAEMRGRGVDPIADLRWAIAADNAVVEGIAGATFGVHMCRSYVRSSFGTEIFDRFAEILFSELVHDRLLLDIDTRLPDPFRGLRFVPKEKQVVLGLVASHRSEIETVDTLLRLIEEASRWFPVENLAISPSCGFASPAPGKWISREVQWQKMDVLVEAASQIWV
jgi:5-methyltetrahydropteroyltriglutamate--homocysteine methyltransferase